MVGLILLPQERYYRFREEFKKNDYIIYEASYFYADNCIFKDGNRGVHDVYNTETLITNCTFDGMADYALKSYGTITSCHFLNNNIAVNLTNNLNLSNCMIENNDIGILAYYSLPISNYSVVNNQICNNTINFEHLYSYPITMTNNYWCSSDENEIKDGITDAFDNVSLGIVSYSPFLTEEITLSSQYFYKNSNLTLYPNPTNSAITFSGGQILQYEIIDITGTVVKSGKDPVNNNVSVSTLEEGIYIISLINKL